jgi:hypothetical protein
MLIAAAALASLAVVGCGTTAGGAVSQVRTEQSMSSKPAPSVHTGFAGYKWQVVAITRDGKEAPIPARYKVYLTFTPTGQFGANEPVNYHSGIYRTTSDGFTTSGIVTSAVGYAGDDQDTLLAIGAISAFNDGVHATATVTGDRLAVTVGTYLLDCQRVGTA